MHPLVTLAVVSLVSGAVVATVHFGVEEDFDRPWSMYIVHTVMDWLPEDWVPKDSFVMSGNMRKAMWLALWALVVLVWALAMLTWCLWTTSAPRSAKAHQDDKQHSEPAAPASVMPPQSSPVQSPQGNNINMHAGHDAHVHAYNSCTFSTARPLPSNRAADVVNDM